MHELCIVCVVFHLVWDTYFAFLALKGGASWSKAIKMGAFKAYWDDCVPAPAVLQ